MTTSQHQTSSVGSLLQYWRRTRNLSQLALSIEADVSPRHICFLETGRAKPSRDMVMLLSLALRVPLRERNAILLAAGFAPVYQETSLDSPELAPVRRALDAMLGQQEPYPAVVMNRRWDLLLSNQAASRFFGFLLDQAAGSERNVLRLIFHPKKLRPFVLNWEAVAEALVQRVHREAVGAVKDQETEKLLEEVLSYPGVPARWRLPNLEKPLVPILPISFQKSGRAFHFFSAVTTIGTPQDITLQEIRVECFFPLDEETQKNARKL